MVEIFLFIIVSGLVAHFIGASVHEGIFVGALVPPSGLRAPMRWRTSARSVMAQSVCLAGTHARRSSAGRSAPLLAALGTCRAGCRVCCAARVHAPRTARLLMHASAGAQVSMSSTSIVIKCLSDTKSTNTPHGAITIGTLILQARGRKGRES
jgi:hypothetical protein